MEPSSHGREDLSGSPARGPVTLGTPIGGASWVCQQALPCTWASVGLVMSSFCRKHIVCDSVHLSPEMRSERLILCNAGKIGAVLWPLRGDEGCLRIAG